MITGIAAFAVCTFRSPFVLTFFNRSTAAQHNSSTYYPLPLTFLSSIIFPSLPSYALLLAPCSLFHSPFFTLHFTICTLHFSYGFFLSPHRLSHQSPIDTNCLIPFFHKKILNAMRPTIHPTSFSNSNCTSPNGILPK